MNGTHRRAGFWLGVGDGFAPRRKRSELVDMAPTILAALGLGAPPWFEGRSQLARSGRGVGDVDVSTDELSAWQGYDEVQRAVIEGRLRKLGYI